MAKEEKYYEQLADANTDRLRALLKELPGFCMEYFRSLKNDTEPRTRLEYAKAQDKEEFKKLQDIVADAFAPHSFTMGDVFNFGNLNLPKE